MTDTDQLLQQLDASTAQAKTLVDLGAAFERLAAHRDFKTVIADGYFREEAIRLVHLKSDPAMQTPAAQASILLQIDAIGSLATYFQTLRHRASIAAKAIDDNDSTREEILAEEGAQ